MQKVKFSRIGRYVINNVTLNNCGDFAISQKILINGELILSLPTSTN